MKTPPFLLAAALLFWGWQTNLLVISAVAAALFEGAQVIKWRWEFSATDFIRINDFSVALFFAAVVFMYFTGQLSMQYLEWLPLVALPLLLAQTYSAQNLVNARTLFFLLRKRERISYVAALESPFRLDYPCFAICVLAASAANVQDFRFYAGLAVLAAWSLWPLRTRSVPFIGWGAALLAALGLGYVGQVGLHKLHLLLEQRYTAWISGAPDDASFFESRTALGHIGMLKLSGEIVMRVEAEKGHSAPSYLRQASYNVFRSDHIDSRWLAAGASQNPQSVPSQANRTVWILSAENPPERSVTIATYLKKGAGLLALPSGTVRIENLVALEMQRHPMGAVKVSDATEFVRFRARYAPRISLDSPPTDNDRATPAQEDTALEQLVVELGLRSQTPAQVLETLRGYFGRNFRYSRYQPASEAQERERRTPMSDFLSRNRAGHCEYFASATVLLLRKAGLPARYATGFSVQEYNRRTGQYLVRARHAHAWTLVYLDNAWQDFDTTPSSWSGVEDEAASWWENVTDFWSWLRYQVSKWRLEGGTKGISAAPLLGLVAIMAGLLFFLVWKRRRKAGRPERPSATGLRMRPGLDSEFYRLEQQLAARGYPRRKNETLPAWLRRLETATPPPPMLDDLQPIIVLHYRYRFDPAGLGTDERMALRTEVASWLGRMKSDIPPDGSRGC